MIYAHRKSLFLLSLILISLPAIAMAFGQNKVHYISHVWKTVKTPHFQLYFHENAGPLPEKSISYIESAYDSLSMLFGFTHKTAIPLIIYTSPTNFEQTNIVSDLIPEGVGGFTESFKNRIVIPYDGSLESFRHVLHHELVHAFQYGIIAEQLGSTTRGMPLWFAEGLAEFLSSGWDKEADMFLLDRTIFGQVQPIGPTMNDYMVYKGGQSFFYYLYTTRGRKSFLVFLRYFRNEKNPTEALEKTYHQKLSQLSAEWIQSLKQNYWPEIGHRTALNQIAKPITDADKNHSHFNLYPRFSPDGKKIAYYTDDNDYTRIVIANRKGAIIQSIEQNSSGGYFEAFHPFRSGLAWAPDGHRIAFIAHNKGRDEIRIANLQRKQISKTIALNLDGIFSPDWSHDGAHLVFSGLKNGSLDLYRLTLSTLTLERLTTSLEAETDPRFAPGDSSIIFTMKDTAASVPSLDGTSEKPFSQLFILHLISNELVQLTHTPGNKKQPTFSGDGSKIVFVNDVNGIDNLYSAPRAHPDFAQPLTDIIGGCSQPDLSTTDSSLVVCIFQKQQWNIWLIDSLGSKLKSAPLDPTRWQLTRENTQRDYFTKRAIPPDTVKNSKEKFTPFPLSKAQEPVNYDSDSLGIFEKGDSAKTQGLDTARHQPDSLYTTRTRKDSFLQTTGSKRFPDSLYIARMATPYHLEFSPDMVTVGLGVGSLNGAAGQAVAIFSDMLGDHQIAIAANLQGRIDQYAHFFGSYYSLKHRVNFGIGGFFNRDYSLSFLTDQIFRDTYYGISFSGMYPFSQFMRIEANLNFNQLKRTPVDSQGKLAPTSLHFTMAMPSLQWTFDNTLWGLTGPLNGMRAQAKAMISPPLSIIDAPFISFDADFRKYFHFAKKFVWATKGSFGAANPLGTATHSARRYLLGGNENWLNFRANGKEYDANASNLVYSEFVVPFRGWNYLDITGTRFAVVNTEFRFPFIKEINVVWPFDFSIQYINGSLFADAGNAWDPSVSPSTFSLPNKIYGGVGFGMSINLGIFVLRYDHAWPTDFTTFAGKPVTYFSLGGQF